MVRAAASGVINYTQADPTDNRWRIKHRLLLTELQRQEDRQMLAHHHTHWCSYIGHGSLNPESFNNVKTAASERLNDLYASTFPWAAKKEEKLAADENKETAAVNSKIDSETQRLIERFKIWRQNTTGGTAPEKDK